MSSLTGRAGAVLGFFFSITNPFNPSAFGWGAYGHEQVNRAAAILIKDTEVGQWMEDNLDTIERFSITPDCEWKANRSCKVSTNAHLRELTYFANRYEHPLHFFEPDAYIADGDVTSSSMQAIPAAEYPEAFSTLLKLFTKNMDYVLEFQRDYPVHDPENPTAKDVGENGTAPWRVVQLYDLAVVALSKEDYSLGMMYLGTMGHYVGDLSQPLHVMMDYDGQAHAPSAKGVHATFETKILERAARSAHAEKDTDTKLWSSYDATESDVLSEGRKAFGNGKMFSSHKDILKALYELTSSGYPFGEKLSDLYCDAADDKHESAAAEKRFMKSYVGDDTVLGFADKRMGRSAALLARLWLSAEAEANARTHLSFVRKRVEFSQEFVLENYPVPDYLSDAASADSDDGGE